MGWRNFLTVILLQSSQSFGDQSLAVACAPTSPEFHDQVSQRRDRRGPWRLSDPDEHRQFTVGASLNFVSSDFHLINMQILAVPLNQELENKFAVSWRLEQFYVRSFIAIWIAFKLFHTSTILTISSVWKMRWWRSRILCRWNDQWKRKGQPKVTVREIWKEYNFYLDFF